MPKAREKKTASKTPPGRPFQKGDDPRRGHGLPGRSGRPPNEFKQKMRELATGAAAEKYLEKCLNGDFGPKFFLAAYSWVAEQGYGKATQFVEQTNVNPPTPVNPDEMRVIYALVLGRGMTVPQAENYIRTYPEEVKAWLASNPSQQGRAN